jgi:phospholipase C
LRFLEARFDIPEPNISAWRRSLCGDLTSAFDFSGTPDASAVRFEVPKHLASQHQPYHVPAVQSMPQQEPGTRRARALPYELFAHCRLRDQQTHSVGEKVWIDFANTGDSGAAFYVYDGKRPDDNPRRYTISAGDSFSDYWLTADTQGLYDLSLYGPNGYFCRLRGNALEAAFHGKPNPEVKVNYDVAAGNVSLSLANTGSAPCSLTITNAYGGAPHTYTLHPGKSVDDHWVLASSSAWYDLSVTVAEVPEFLRRFAGHVETGRPSTSDPGIFAGE